MMSLPKLTNAMLCRLASADLLMTTDLASEILATPPAIEYGGDLHPPRNAANVLADGILDTR